MNEEFQQQQSRYSTPASSFSQSILELTNPAKLIDHIEYNLRMATFDKETGVVTCNPDDMLLTEEGLRKLMGVVRSVIAQNTVMSNLNDKNITSLMQDLNYTIHMQLMINRREWKIQSSEDRTMIANMIMNPIFLCLKRPLGQGERGFWKGAIAENVVHSQRVESEGSGSWWKPASFFKR